MIQDYKGYVVYQEGNGWIGKTAGNTIMGETEDGVMSIIDSKRAKEDRIISFYEAAMKEHMPDHEDAPAISSPKPGCITIGFGKVSINVVDRRVFVWIEVGKLFSPSDAVEFGNTLASIGQVANFIQRHLSGGESTE